MLTNNCLIDENISADKKKKMKISEGIIEVAYKQMSHM